MEFPLLQWLAGMLFHVSRERELIARLLSIAFSMGTLLAIYALGKRLLDAPAGRAAALLLAISPSMVFFGRTFISDTPMVFFSVAGILGLASYADTGNRPAAIWGIVCVALACLVKIPALLILAPVAWLAWVTPWPASDRELGSDPAAPGRTNLRLGWRGLTPLAAVGNPIWLSALGVPVLLTALWYWHGDRLFHKTGLGQAIFHPSGGYSPDVSVAMGPMMGVSHWATAHQLGDPLFYSTLLERTYYMHLTPVGFALTIFGLATCWNRPRLRVALVWLGAALLFILASAEGNRYHEFHQLPLLPAAALLFGAAAARAFDGRWLREQTGSRVVPLLSAICVAWIGWLGFTYSNVVQDFFRPDRLDLRMINAGAAVAHWVPPSDTIVVLEYPQYGANSPILLYRAHRKGWSFDLSSISPHVVQRLQRQFGAKYFATTIWSQIEERQPVLAEYLKTQERIPIDVADTALFRLR
jgi:4-amino-4-deoxy-L-arabinose transferase-like glycosyltransferase